MIRITLYQLSQPQGLTRNPTITLEWTDEVLGTEEKK